MFDQNQLTVTPFSPMSTRLRECSSLGDFSRATREHDVAVGEHHSRTAVYTLILGAVAGLPTPEAKSVAAAARVHDLGKIGLDPDLLEKPGRLSAAEWAEIRKHPLLGAQWLTGASSSRVRLAKVIAATHHERWDGSGYPFGLEEDQIPFASRLVALADQYDALRTERPYKMAYGHRVACEIILEGDGRTSPEHFDPKLLMAFARARGELREVERAA